MIKTRMIKTRPCLTALAALLLTWAPGVSLAQDAEIEIAAQPLEAAIAELNAQTGLSILAPLELVEGRTSPGVAGQMTPVEALTVLLSGTGLTIERLDETSVVVAEGAPNGQAEEDGTVLAAPVLVQGELRTRSLQETTTSAVVYSGAELDSAPDFNIKDII
ncbi:MAG: STN domain-containing protein, partial [Pseudomonadota bacterium]